MMPGEYEPMGSALHSLRIMIADFLFRDQSPHCALCGRKMKTMQIEPLLTTRVDVVTFTCKSCGAGEKRARRRPAKAAKGR